MPAVTTHSTDGGALPADGRMMMGSDGSLAQFIKTDSDGNLQVDILSGTVTLSEDFVFAEDAAAGSGDSGVMVLGVRRDTAASSSGTDGDYSTLNLNASGRLYTSATVDAALPAGTNNIGDVDVLTLPALVAGTAIIGNVMLDQTTPGTTNGVVVNSGTLTAVTAITNALPAGTNAIGKLAANSGVDIGDVDVTSLPALAAGSAIIGKVGIDQTTPGTTNGVVVNSGTLTTVTTVSAVTAISNALPAGTNAIGKLAANSGVDIGDVDVTSIAAGDNNIGNVDIVTNPTAATMATNQIAVTNASTLIIASNASRKFLEIMNFNSAALFIGNSGLTTSNGHYIAAGASYTMDASVCTAAVYGIFASDPSAAKVSYLEA